ncbi:MAG: zinc ribbon domain-containing protein [Planctomyces sp.]|nr:zinc ribbon domain-containing protein [Planctomyces sp.]
MPLFEFRCSSCQREFEALVRNGEQPHCPNCDATRLEKLLSAPARPAALAGALPIASACPPPQAGPCGPGCCRLPMG